MMSDISEPSASQLRDPTLATPPKPRPPSIPLEHNHTSLVDALNVLTHPLVQNVLRDSTLMKPVMEHDTSAINKALRVPSMQALLSDTKLIQKIADLASEGPCVTE